MERWSLQNIVTVDTGHSTAPAKVSDLQSLDDGRFAVVYCWLYTREDILDELKVDGAVPSLALSLFKPTDKTQPEWLSSASNFALQLSSTCVAVDKTY
jgi:hypothetical protein